MVDLSLSEYKIFSQNGEDGVILAIFDTIGITNKVCVEIGAEPHECNTRNLLECGWNTVCIDLHTYNVPYFKKEFVTPSNINTIFDKYKIPNEFDFLSIDVDGNDFHLWNNLRYKPRVICIEHNSSLGPSADMVVPISEVFKWDGTNYFGASLLAMVKLGENNGYTLVYVERNGVNAFFVLNSCLRQKMFKNQGNILEIYRPPLYGNGILGNPGGHPLDVLNRHYNKSDDYIKTK